MKVLQLAALATAIGCASLAQAADTYTLTLHDGRSYPVMFRRTDGPAVQAEPVIDYPDPVSSDPYYLHLRLMQPDR